MEIEWEVSYDPTLKRDVIVVDTGDDIITLTKQTLLEMLKELSKYE